MATTVSFNGTNYSVPNNRDPKGWGTALTAYLVALGTALAKSGGNFTLTADVNFGANYGLIAVYYKSASADIATIGVFRLANNEGIAWRNAANAADLLLKVDASDDLVYDGNRILDTTDIIDEDDLVSDSATKVPTQQSVKAYVDTGLSSKQNSSNAVTTDGAQTITAVKTLDTELGFKHITTPSNPASGYMKLYPKSDGTFYILDSAGTETQIAGINNSTTADSTQQFLAIDYRETSKAADSNFDGGTFYFTRVGRLVTLEWRGLTHTTMSTSSVSTSSGFIPSGFRPSATTIFNTSYYDETRGENVIVYGTGQIFKVYKNESGGVNQTSCVDGSITYITADS